MVGGVDEVKSNVVSAGVIGAELNVELGVIMAECVRGSTKTMPYAW
jgi:exosome complex RNA-binding protein Csl4